MKQNSNLELSMISNFLPNSSLIKPAFLHTTASLLSAIKNNTLPTFRLAFSNNAFLSSSVKNLSIGPFKDLSSFYFVCINAFPQWTCVAYACIPGEAQKNIGHSGNGVREGCHVGAGN